MKKNVIIKIKVTLGAIMFGLSKEHFYIIIKILSKYSQDIEEVKIFGSRARGNYKKTSDIDLALKFREDKITDLMMEFEESALPYKVDLIDYLANNNETLKNYIDKEGKVIFTTTDEGETTLNLTLIENKFLDYQKVLNKLEVALGKDPHEDDLYLDAIIQRFEFTYELSWKLMKAWLDYNGVSTNSPRTAFREAFKMELIENADKWIKMLENRNRTSHTYNEETAWAIYEEIKSKYINYFNEFKLVIESEIKE